MKASSYLMIRIEPARKKELAKEAKQNERTLSNYVLYMVDKARGKAKK